MSNFATAKMEGRTGKPKAPPTFIPIRSEGAKRKQYQCEACWKMVPGTEYDPHERLCTRCMDAMREPLKARGFVDMLRALFRKKEASGASADAR